MKRYLLFLPALVFLCLLLTACGTPHEHVFSGNWGYNKGTHWLVCAQCGTTIADASAHTMITNDGQEMCSICGYRPYWMDLEFFSEGDLTCVGGGKCVETEIVFPSTSPKGIKIDAIGATQDGNASLFQDGTKLVSVIIPEGVTNIGIFAFGGCSNLSSVQLPKSLKYIGRAAFSGCSNLSAIDLPNDLYALDDLAFYNCNRLENINIPQSVRSVGANIFLGCEKILYTEYDNALYVGNPDNPYQVLVVAKQKNIDSCHIHPDTRAICSFAFEGCTELTEISLPDGITRIDTAVFSGCSKLQNIVIPGSVTSIGRVAFHGCHSLVSVSYGSSASNDIDALKSNIETGNSCLTAEKVVWKYGGSF